MSAVGTDSKKKYPPKKPIIDQAKLNQRKAIAYGETCYAEAVAHGYTEPTGYGSVDSNGLQIIEYKNPKSNRRIRLGFDYNLSQFVFEYLPPDESLNSDPETDDHGY